MSAGGSIGIDVELDPSLTSFDAPLLTSVGGEQLNIGRDAALTSVALPSLNSGHVTMCQDSSLQSVVAPHFTSASGAWWCQ